VFYQTGFRRPSLGVPRKDFSKVNRKSEALRKKKFEITITTLQKLANCNIGTTSVHQQLSLLLFVGQHILTLCRFFVVSRYANASPLATE
jgi:hypothetical protein